MVHLLVCEVRRLPALFACTSLTIITLILISFLKATVTYVGVPPTVTLKNFAFCPQSVLMCLL